MFRLTGQDAHVSADGCIVTAQDPAWPAQSFLALALPSPSILRAFLGDLLRLLAPGGTVQCALAPEVPQEHSLQLQQMLRAELVLCGFTSLAEAGAGPAWSATAVKPAWAGSSGAPLRGALLRKPTSAPAPASGGLEQGVVLVGAAVAGAGAGAAWSASGGALVDENALLAGEDFAEGRAAAGGEGGCATKRKACANCSCGCVFFCPCCAQRSAFCHACLARSHHALQPTRHATPRAGERRWKLQQRRAAVALPAGCPTPRQPRPPAPAGTAARVMPSAARAAPTWASPPLAQTPRGW